MKGSDMVKRYDIDVPDGEFVERASGRVVLYDDFAAVVAERDAMKAECDRLRAIVGRLPFTADGEAVTPGQLIWPTAEYWIDGDEEGTPVKYRFYIVDHDGAELTEADELEVSKCYSTREAAVAAQKGTP